jgi:hypothetical protein
MAAFTVKAETFNNCFGFERDLWQRKAGPNPTVPKRRVLGAIF